MDKSLIVNKLKRNKEVFKKQFGILKIGLFGSYSTNNQHQNSDIDLVYELEEGKFLGLKELYELEVFLKDLFKIDKVDVVNKKYINPIIESEMVKTVIYV